MIQTQPKEMSVLVTGAAGFIGYHLCRKLLLEGYSVAGVDDLDPYYDLELKEDRVAILEQFDTFRLYRVDLSDRTATNEVFDAHNPSVVVHLAAQAGVRYSLDHPEVYIQSNIVGFFNVLEACRTFQPICLLFASSSSVYGENSKVPFDENDRVDSPCSLYAMTKRADEQMTYVYHKLYNVNSIGMRFFTVYGPYGRPDMAYYQFLDKYFAGEAIHIYDDPGFPHDMYRDFTYIDDVVDSILGLLRYGKDNCIGHEIFNIGNSHPEKLAVFIQTLETCLGASLGRTVEFTKIFDGLAQGDVNHTYASVAKLESVTGHREPTMLRTGLQRFCDWYVEYHSIPVAAERGKVQREVGSD